jgi:hypothetical protein
VARADLRSGIRGRPNCAQGTAAGDEFKAAELDRAAQYGELKAAQMSGSSPTTYP